MAYLDDLFSVAGKTAPEHAAQPEPPPIATQACVPSVQAPTPRVAAGPS